MVKKLMITMHIADYLALIIVDVISYYFYFGSLRAYEISVISGLLVYCVCNVIFCLIVNQIVNKTQAITLYLESIASSLLAAAVVASDLVNQPRNGIMNA
jgi:hypothetical protein